MNILKKSFQIGTTTYEARTWLNEETLQAIIVSGKERKYSLEISVDTAVDMNVSVQKLVDILIDDFKRLVQEKHIKA